MGSYYSYYRLPCQWVGYSRQHVNSQFLKFGVLEAGKIGKSEDLSVFDKGEILMARCLGHLQNRSPDIHG